MPTRHTVAAVVAAVPMTAESEAPAVHVVATLAVMVVSAVGVGVGSEV